MSTAETIVGFVPFVARSICENCGSYSVAIGPQARQVLAEAADVHDRECQDLREAARLIRGPIRLLSIDLLASEGHPITFAEVRESQARQALAEIRGRVTPP